MEKYIPLLKNTNMFRGVTDAEIASMFHCLDTKVVTYKKGEFIIRNGDQIHSMGMVLSGLAMIEQEDYWGNCTILQEVTPGSIFAESYACLAEFPAEISVVANAQTSIMFFDMKKILTVCTSACSYHSRLIQNLLGTMARKNVSLTKKIEFMTKKTIRERLLAYLSTESLKQGNATFEIPFNRQHLAEYLSVDRSALSNEISKLQKEGILTCHRNTFTLLTQ